jgi:hypothetical protein
MSPLNVENYQKMNLAIVQEKFFYIHPSFDTSPNNLVNI